MFIAVAVDGIAVSTQSALLWPTDPGGDIIRYDIKNSDVVAVRKLIDGGGGSNAANRGAFPALDFSGKRIAFYHFTAGGKYVSVMNADGTGLRDLARIPDGTGYNAWGYLDWNRQGGSEWIYYILGGDEFGNEGNKHLWRVNVDNPQLNAEVVKFQYYVWQWGMSADASRMILRICCDAGMPGEMFKYILPGAGAITSSTKIDYGAGCGVALSPSGQWLMYLSGGSHTYMVIRNWDKVGIDDPQIPFTAHPQINSWAVNSSAFKTHCAWYESTNGIDISLGFGMDCNRWSSNSDKWLCLHMGWLESESGSGRDGICGANQVVANWQDSIAVNVSKNPRACADNGQFAPTCDKNSPASEFRRNDAGDFIVTAPVTDVNQDLRQYLTNAVDHQMTGRFAGGAIDWRVARGTMEIILDGKGQHTVTIADAAGRPVRTRSGRTAISIPCGDLAPGVYMVRLSGIQRCTTWMAALR
jgi:hypothetical protein